MSTAPNETALAPSRREPLGHLKNLLDAARPSMAAVIPKHLTPERLIKVALVAVSRTPALMQADPMTVVQSVMQAAQLGLDPAGVLGGAYLVPFRNSKTGRQECQLIVGYRGLLDLARRSGQIESVEARVVREADHFKVRFGTDTAVEHVPCIDGDPGALRFVYGVAWLKDTPRPVVEVMTRAEIEKIRRRAKAGESGPWVSDYDEMARKTVIRRLAKYLPLTTELATGLELSGISHDTAEIVALPGVEVTPAPDQSAAGPGEVVTVTGEVVEATALPAQASSAAVEASTPASPEEPAPLAAPASRAGRIAAKARAAASAPAVPQPDLI